MAVFQPVNENLPNSSCHFRKHKSIFLHILHQSSVPSNITHLHFFLAQTLYTLVKGSRLKCKFFRFSSARIKICQISRVNFGSTSQFSFKLVPSNITPLYFLSSNIIYLGQKQPIKVQISETFECSGQNFLNSSYQF